MSEAVPLTARVAEWIAGARFEDLPEQAVRFVAREPALLVVARRVVDRAQPGRRLRDVGARRLHRAHGLVDVAAHS